MSGRYKLLGFGALASVSAVCIWYLHGRWKATKQNKKTVQRMTLYFYPKYRSTRCIWLATELGVRSNIDMKRMDPQDPDRDKTTAYRENIHPHCTIPALVLEDGHTIIESGAICLYLASIYQRLLPDAEWQADFYNWSVYACSTLDDMMEIIFVQWYWTEPKDQNHTLINKMTDKFKVFAKYFSKHMEGKQYICGDRFTAVDCIIGYNIWWASTLHDGCLIKDYPEILSYLTRLKRRVAFQQTFDL